MLTLKKKTALLLEEAVKKAFGEGLLSADEIFEMLEYPPDRSMGDIALPCFRLSKSLRKAPPMIASALAESLSCEEFSEINAMGGYLNFRISPTAFASRVVSDIRAAGDKYGSPMCGEGKRVVLDVKAIGKRGKLVEHHLAHIRVYLGHGVGLESAR